MGFERLAEHRIREAQARGALEGLTGEALQEALILRGAGGVPPEVEAMRRVAALRERLGVAKSVAERRQLASELGQAEMEAALLFERTGRMTLARAVRPL